MKRSPNLGIFVGVGPPHARRDRINDYQAHQGMEFQKLREAIGIPAQVEGSPPFFVRHGDELMNGGQVRAFRC
jgi:hypothetical protein